MFQLFWLATAGLLAGIMNAVAGGGSFVTYPALVAVGLPPIAANATSTVALFPGTLASTRAYRRQTKMTGIADIPIRTLLLLSTVGGMIGAILLLVSSDIRN